MKIHIAHTFHVSIKQMKILVDLARISGYDYDNLNDARKIIRRLLIGEMEDCITYCEERSQPSR
jgi:hypothetical protein